LKAGGFIDAKLTSILEKLADYCDDVLTPQKATFLIAKVKGTEEKKVSPTNSSIGIGRKPPPIPLSQKSMPVPKEFSDSKSPTKKFQINGPVKILRDQGLKDSK